MEGRITVNGQLLMELPCFVTPASDRIEVDGNLVRRPGRAVYYLLNKPRNVVCTSDDPYGRRTAVSLLRKTVEERVYCVGRLDAESTGLILLTNDGELTQHLTHPRYEVAKRYLVSVAGRLAQEQIETLRNGMYIGRERAPGMEVKVLQRDTDQTTLEIDVHETRNSLLRRVLKLLGHKVRQLKRTAIGPISDRHLAPGEFRELTAREVDQLRHCGREME